MNIFEQATRCALRFETVRGHLTVEDLWSLPLSATSKFDLDTTAKGLSKALKEFSEESFVEQTQSTAQDELNLKLEIVKHVIAVKIAEREAKLAAATKAQERQKLLSILERKSNESLESLSADEIQKRLAAL